MCFNQPNLCPHVYLATSTKQTWGSGHAHLSRGHGEQMQKTLSRFLIAAVVLTAVCLPCFAQQGNLRTVLFIKLKMDQQDNWKAAVKDLVALHQKAGGEHTFTIWESQTGPSEFAVVWYDAKWKDIGVDDPKLKSSAAD